MSAPVEQGGALAGGLRAGASELGLSLAPPQVDQLLAYLALISKWNRVYNLTAVREPGEMLTQHLLDSLAIVLPLQRQLGGRPASVLDVGAGAGLPGVALAVACPQLQVSCVDAVAKKVSFIRQAAAELGLRNLQGVHARVESLAPKTWDVITSRAFASLPDFVAWTRGSLAQGGVWLAMKGKRPDAEIAELPEDVEVFHVEHLQVPGLEAERCIVWMRHKN
ncbi:16S rRNA (guanine(527)-N(7))-methyltransferase RsmG [Methylibium rhizosphaerae]|uniref:16S rRNA (guanine(527)-N(7))-methyltransferase RsmG n=1 Tax=Methylibium rhizosphaerae TaxID=2570323 RepID=UPI003CCC69E6